MPDRKTRLSNYPLSWPDGWARDEARAELRRGNGS